MDDVCLFVVVMEMEKSDVCMGLNSGVNEEIAFIVRLTELVCYGL